MRADGLKNRTAILRAASKIFAEKGFNAPLRLITTEAGVSRTTLYRNFDNREQLGLAIFDGNIVKTKGYAQQLKGNPQGFLTILALIMDDFIRDAGLTEAVHHQEGMEHIKKLMVQLLDCVEPLMLEAQSADKIRVDFTREDLELIFRMFGSALPQTSIDERKQQGGRILEIILSGISTK